MKQTAVEWLAEIVAEMGYVSIDILEQAKAMEKEQIIESWDDGYDNGYDLGKYDDQLNTDDAEQYYNKTFKSE